MAKLSVEMILQNTAQFERRVQESINRASQASFIHGRFVGPQYGGGLASGKSSQAMATSGNYGLLAGLGNWEYLGAVPPRIRGGTSQTNMGMAGLGLAAGAFSPWIGARLMNQSGIFNRLGAGGGGSGVMGALFGPGGYGGFGVAYLGLSIATRALKSAFEELKDSVTRVARLYQESAAINRPLGRIFQIQSAFKAIGLSEDAAKRYAKSGPGGLNAEEMMQLTNQSDSFKRNMADAAMDANIISNAAQASQDSFERMTALTREWKTLWTSLAPLIEDSIVKPLLGITKLLNIFQELGGIVGSGGKKNDPFEGLAGGKGMFNWNSFRTTSMERMGFTIGGNGIGSKIDTTNRILRQIATGLGVGIGGGNFGGTGPATNLP